MTHKTALDSFQEFLENISATEPAANDRVFLAAGILELMRRVKNNDTLLAVAKLLAEVPDTGWQRIPFSVTQKFLGAAVRDQIVAAGVAPADVPHVLLTALSLFVAFVPTDVELSDAILTDVVAAAVDNHKAAKAPPAPHRVEVFNEGLVSRAFVPATPDDTTFKKLNAALVYFRGELPGAKLGPDIRGLAFDTAVTPQPILLETGEIVYAPKNALTVAAANTAADFKAVPASLLLSASLASVQLFMRGIIEKEHETFLNSGGLGKPAQQIHSLVVDVNDLEALRHVFDKGRESLSMGVTGPSGATVRFPVPQTDMAVVIDARHSEAGPYSVSRLVRTNADGDDTILMRHDTPRLFTPRGVYIFPTKDSGLVSLIAI
jgi:hypothetical protein